MGLLVDSGAPEASLDKSIGFVNGINGTYRRCRRCRCRPPSSREIGSLISAPMSPEFVVLAPAAVAAATDAAAVGVASDAANGRADKKGQRFAFSTLKTNWSLSQDQATCVSLPAGLSPQMSTASHS